MNKKHLTNVGPIRHCEPPHAHSAGVATGTVARRLRIDVHDDNNDNDDNDNDNAWQRGPLWPHGMGPIMSVIKPVNSTNLLGRSPLQRLQKVQQTGRVDTPSSEVETQTSK